MSKLSYFMLLWAPRFSSVLSAFVLTWFVGLAVFLMTGNAAIAIIATIILTWAGAILINRSCERDVERRAKRYGRG